MSVRTPDASDSKFGKGLLFSCLPDGWFSMERLHLPKTNMTLENSTMNEDVFPNEFEHG